MLTKFRIIFIFSLFTSLLCAQNESEAEKNLKFIKRYKGINNDSLLHYSIQLQSAKNICLKYVGKIHEVLAIYNTEKYVDAEKLSHVIINELEDKNELCLIKIKIEALNRLFWIKKNQQLYNEALNYLLLIQNNINSFPKESAYFKNIQITIKLNTALIQSLLGNHIISRKTLKECLKENNFGKQDALKKYSYILNKANVLNLIGESYLQSYVDNNISHLDSASIYFKKAYEVAQKFNPPHKNSETIYNLREAEILIAKKEFRKALYLINSYSSNSEKFNTTQNINSLKAICFYNLNKKDSTLYFSNRYIQNLTKQNSKKKRLIAIYDILSNQYYKNKELDSAYKYSTLTIDEIKILNNNKNEVNKAYYLYDYKNAQELNSSILKKEEKSKQTLILAIVTISVLTFISLIYLLKRNKNITSDLIKIKEKTPQKTAYNIDDELEKSLLNGIYKLEKSEDFLDTNFNINTLAKKLNTNTSYLSYFINKEFKQTFKQYITQLRIEYLIEKLNEENSIYKNYSIKSLGEEIGYTNASAFTRAFKKLKGITPSEYIKRLENGD